MSEDINIALPGGPDALSWANVLTMPPDPQCVGNLLPSRRPA